MALFTSMADSGGIDHFLRFDPGFAAGFYTYFGKMVNAFVANHFNLPVADIALFMPGY